MKKIIIAGHICLDITPIFSNEYTGKSDKILTAGETIHMDTADIHTGGVVANTGLAMKILGSDVKLVGKIGEDAFGDIINNILDEYDVDNKMIIDTSSTSSYSIVISPPGIDRIFLHHPGANATFSNLDLSDDLFEDVGLFHFGYPPLMKRMYENQGEELVRLFKRVKEKGIVTSLDMTAVDANSDAGKQDWRKILTRLLPYVDIFAPSAEEIGYMLDAKLFSLWKERAQGRDVTEIISIKEDVDPLGKQLIEMGSKIVLIKCGAPGLYYRTSNLETISNIADGFIKDPLEWADRSGFEKSYKQEKVLSGTGAGDTTIAAFLTSINMGYSLEKCLQLATATGALSVTQYDALSGLKTIPEMEDMIQKGWEKC